MFITLTNASEAHRGNKISINTNIIVTVYQTKNLAKMEDGIIENITYVFCPPHGTWEVEEPLDEVISQLNDYEWNKK
jgi:hypothetical protein